MSLSSTGYKKMYDVAFNRYYIRELTKKREAQNAATIARNADGLNEWLIYTQYVEGLVTRSNTIAEGKTLAADTFTRLIDLHDLKYIDAEFSTGTKIFSRLSLNSARFAGKPAVKFLLRLKLSSTSGFTASRR